MFCSFSVNVYRSYNWYETFRRTNNRTDNNSHFGIFPIHVLWSDTYEINSLFIFHFLCHSFLFSDLKIINSFFPIILCHVSTNLIISDKVYHFLNSVVSFINSNDRANIRKRYHFLLAVSNSTCLCSQFILLNRKKWFSVCTTISRSITLSVKTLSFPSYPSPNFHEKIYCKKYLYLFLIKDSNLNYFLINM